MNIGNLEVDPVSVEFDRFVCADSGLGLHRGEITFEAKDPEGRAWKAKVRFSAWDSEHDDDECLRIGVVVADKICSEGGYKAEASLEEAREFGRFIVDAVLDRDIVDPIEELLRGLGEKYSGDNPRERAHDWAGLGLDVDGVSAWIEAGVWFPRVAELLDKCEVRPSDLGDLRSLADDVCQGIAPLESLISAAKEGC